MFQWSSDFPILLTKLPIQSYLRSVSRVPYRAIAARQHLDLYQPRLTIHVLSPCLHHQKATDLCQTNSEFRLRHRSRYIELSASNSLNTLPTENNHRLTGSKISAFVSQNRHFCSSSCKSKQISVIRPSLKIMKLSTPEFNSLFTPELKAIIEIFEKYGFELRIAGGAVRDLLDGKIPNDVDFATTATPSEMKDMFNAEEIRMINSNGEAHGTITARINDKENFEVTTLRIDVVTDGRRAQVEFTKDWMLDANRRDLTINSMFLGFDGTVYDYFNGVEDLKGKRVRFVGDPVERIQEDYLRILRYFRFFGRIAETPNAHEEVTTQAIKENAEGLHRVSGERIWIEMRKIISGKMAASLIEKMLSLGLGPPIGLPNVQSCKELHAVCEYTEGKPHHHMTRLSSVFENEADVYKLHEKCKISNDELSLALFIVHHRGDVMGDDLIRYCTDLHTDSAGKEAKVINKIVELMKYIGRPDVAEEFPNVQLPQFPLTGAALTACDVPKGPKFACTLNELRRIWKESSYNLSKEELCRLIPEVLENLPKDLKKMRKK